MDEPNLIARLRATPIGSLLQFFADHEDELDELTEFDVAGLDGYDHAAHPGCAEPQDLRLMVMASRCGGPELVECCFQLAAAEVELETAGTSDDTAESERLLSEALGVGLVLIRALPEPVLAARVTALCGAVEDLGAPSTRLLALSAGAWAALFNATTDLSHADAAIESFRAVLAPPADVDPLDDPGVLGARLALALTLAARNRISLLPDDPHLHLDLLEAIAIVRGSVVDETDGGDDDDLSGRHMATRTLLVLLAELLDLTGDTTVADDAISVLQRLSLDAPAGTQVFALCHWWELRFQHSGQLADLDRAITFLAEAVADATIDDHYAASPHVLLEQRSHLLKTRFDHSGELGDLRRALTDGEQSLALQPVDQDQWHRAANNLSVAWHRLGDLTSELTAVRRGVELMDAALAACPDDDERSRGLYRRNLAGRLSDLYALTGEHDALDRAIYVMELAVAENPRDDVEMLRNQKTLASDLVERFCLTGDESDLDRAVNVLSDRDQVDLLSLSEQADRANVTAMALNHRWLVQGSADDLDRAIDVLRPAVEAQLASLAQNEIDATTVGNLGMFLNHRFRATGSLTDLDEAVRYSEDAVALFPPGHRHHTGYSTNLAQRRLTRFELTGDDADAASASDLARAVVANTAPDDVQRPVRVGNLGIMLATIAHRWVQVGRRAEALVLLDEARLHLAHALEHLPTTGYGYPNALSGAGVAWLETHLAAGPDGGRGSEGALDFAIDHLERALELLPPGPDRADTDAALATALVERVTGGQAPAGGEGAPAPDLLRSHELAGAALAATPATSPYREERQVLVDRIQRLLGT